MTGAPHSLGMERLLHTFAPLTETTPFAAALDLGIYGESIGRRVVELEALPN